MNLTLALLLSILSYSLDCRDKGLTFCEVRWWDQMRQGTVPQGWNFVYCDHNGQTEPCNVNDHWKMPPAPEFIAQHPDRIDDSPFLPKVDPLTSR